MARNTQRSVEELTEWIKDLEKEERKALAQHGEGSREHRAASHDLANVRQRLDAARAEEERKEESAKRPTKQIVDEVQGRVYDHRITYRR
jgi:uncharacterized protein YdaT